jgi:mannosyltransferase
LVDDAVAVVPDPTSSKLDRDSGPTAGHPLVVRALRYVWLWPSMFMAAIGLWRIDHPQMWQDELVTVSVVSRSTRQILSLLRQVDAVHGAYYLFMHGWVRVLGDSPVSIRTPSALAMAGATACVALIGARLFDRWVGLLSGFVFALIPSISRFAQETRSYAFVVLFSALATLLLLRALERPTLARWAAYTACIVAISCLNTVAVSIIVGHGVGILVRSRREWTWSLLWKFVLAAVAGVLPASPVIYLGLQQSDRQVSWISHDVPWSVWPKAFASSWLPWAVTALAVVALVRHRRRAAFPMAVALAPLVAIALVSLGPLNYFFSKYLLFLMPVWAVLASTGLAALRAKRTALWTAVPIVGLAVLAVLAVPGQLAVRRNLSHSNYEYPDPPPRPAMAYRDAANLIAKNYQPGDGIVYQRKFWWYMHDEGVSYYLPSNARPRDIFLGQSAAARNELYATECAVPQQCFHNERRVWLVIPYPIDDALGQFPVEQELPFIPNYTQVLLTHPAGMTVALLQHK